MDLRGVGGYLVDGISCIANAIIEDRDTGVAVAVRHHLSGTGAICIPDGLFLFV